MAKMSERQVIQALGDFYHRYDGVKFKAVTGEDISRVFPNWRNDPELGEKIGKYNLEFNDFFKEKKRVFDKVFQGWTVAQIFEFAKKYDSVLENYDVVKNNKHLIRESQPISQYAWLKKEAKMRHASVKLKEQLGDSLDFKGFDNTVKIYGGKEILYSALQERWIKEQQKFGKN